MELSTCDQSTESVCSPCEDLSIIPVKQLKGTRLEWSTVCKEGYNCRGTKSCLFCGHLYAGGPDRTRYHLGLSRGSQKHMKLCNPSKKLNEDIESKMSGLLKQTGAMIISDGWTSVQSRPIINALLTTPAGTMFLKALDTSGNVKDAEFIADFICAIIEARGPKNIVAVCMDGACTASFPLIEDKYPHVFCFICPTHALDNFMKNVFSDKEKIKMKSIVGEFDWDSKHLSYHFRRPPNLDCWRPTTTIL